MNIYLLFANGVVGPHFPHAYEPRLMCDIWDYNNFYNVCDLYEDPIVDNNLIIIERNYFPELGHDHNVKIAEAIKNCKNKKIIIINHGKCISSKKGISGLLQDKWLLFDLLGYEPKNVQYIVQIAADMKHVKNQLHNDVKVTHYDRWLEELNRYVIKYGFVTKKKFLEKSEPLPDKIFSLFIGRYEDIRLEVMCDFISKDLLKDFHYTFAGTKGFMEQEDVSISVANFVNNLPVRYRHCESKIRDWSLGIPYRVDEYNPNAGYDAFFTSKQNDYFLSSKISVVVETHFHNPDDFSIITEKTYKAMLFKKPFILLSHPYTLQVLRECGYKTFSNVIDESYDKIEDLSERIDAITNECNRIRNLDPESLQNLIDNCQSAVERNFQHMLRESFRKVPQEYNVYNFINSP